MTFEWDEKKAESNLKKHGISFDEAATVLTNVGTVTFYESHPKEDRWLSIGFSAIANLLTVIHCERGEGTIRIISARKATAEEREQYEKNV